MRPPPTPGPPILRALQAARMIRPVRQLASRAAEMVGSLEQYNMAIRCPDGGAGGTKGLRFTHEEFGAINMLSVVASLTPYSGELCCQLGRRHVTAG